MDRHRRARGCGPSYARMGVIASIPRSILTRRQMNSKGGLPPVRIWRCRAHDPAEASQ